MENNLKKYLLKEGSEMFTVEVESKEKALWCCEVYNAVLIKEIK